MAQLILLWVIVWLIFIAKSAVPFFVGFPILTSWIPTCQKWESNWIPSSDKWESSWELDSHLSKTSGNLAPNFFMWLFGGFRPQNFLFRKQILFFCWLHWPKKYVYFQRVLICKTCFYKPPSELFKYMELEQEPFPSSPKVFEKRSHHVLFSLLSTCI